MTFEESHQTVKVQTCPMGEKTLNDFCCDLVWFIWTVVFLITN